MTKHTLDSWLTHCRSAVDQFMEPLFQDAWPPSFVEPVRYPLFGGGKRVRPALTLAAYQSVASDPNVLTPILPAAAAIEIIHTYSLVHDDLPAMDDDATRRGRPTVHVAFSESTAILAGDALLTEAFAVLARAPLDASVRIALVARLAHAAGYAGMIGGQAGDIGFGASVSDVQTLQRIHELKTGALFQACTGMGAVVAGATPEQTAHLETVGQCVGLAFQLADDVLDADQDSAQDGPPSYVRLLGVAETKRRAEQLAKQATEAAQALPRPDTLLALARYIVEREH